MVAAEQSDRANAANRQRTLGGRLPARIRLSITESIMPLQNRVTPFGEIVAVPDRGSFMGNRGRIHNEQRTLKTRHWDRKAWITCLLQFKGRRRPIMAPSTYTELFFLDEATAFAAGHRPCGECRRADAKRFKSLWLEANGALLPGKAETMANLDAVFHSERIGRDSTQNRWVARISELPDGAMVLVDDARAAFLLQQGHLYLWSAAGYVERKAIPPGRTVTVLTPPSVTRALAAGYRPVVHPSVDALVADR